MSARLLNSRPISRIAARPGACRRVASWTLAAVLCACGAQEPAATHTAPEAAGDSGRSSTGAVFSHGDASSAPPDALDAGPGVDKRAPDAAGDRPGPDVHAGPTDADAGVVDAGALDAQTAGSSDAGGADPGDVGPAGAPGPDGQAQDGGQAGLIPVDAASEDAGSSDTGTPDTGIPDAAAQDAGPADVGAQDIGAPDAGPQDAGLTGPVPPPNFKVAFIGDQGIVFASQAVLALVKKEQAEALLVLGDFDYEDNPNAWGEMLTKGLGETFPIFAVAGNHDMPKLGEYQKIMQARLAKLPEANCQGEVLVQQDCVYKGLHMVFVAPGLKGQDHDKYLEQRFAQSQHLWQVGGWHKNMKEMQTGQKIDETGWGVYQACQKHGALVMTGHEHAYNRTFTLTKLGDSAAGHGAIGTPDVMLLGPGKTFVTVTGVGGKEVRPYMADIHAKSTWWSTIYTADHWMKNGDKQLFYAGSNTAAALFIVFHVDGNPKKAKAYVKNTLGTLIDAYTIWLQ